MLDTEEKNNSTVLPPIRIPRNLLAAAKAKARRKDESISQVVRRALTEYVEDVKQGDLFDSPGKPKSRKKK